MFTRKLSSRLTRLIVPVVALALALTPISASAAQMHESASTCIALANGSGDIVCYTPLAGTEVAGAQLDSSGNAMAASSPVEVAGVMISSDAGSHFSCVFDADAAHQSCTLA